MRRPEPELDASDFVVLADYVPSIIQEIRYHSTFNFVGDRIESPLCCSAKIRYRHKEQPCTVTQPEDDLLKVVFDEPQRAITPGQSVVLYDGDVVIGGGVISEEGI